MAIRFAVCSDTHDGIPPSIDTAGISAWLHAGDVYEGSNHSLTADAPDDDFLVAEDWKNGAALRQWTAEQGVPVYAVRGNHDLRDYWKVFDVWQDVGARIVQLADRLFVMGLGWHGERYFETPGEADLEPISQRLLRQARRVVMPKDSLILLTHYPALLSGLFPASGDVEAFACIRQLVEELAPVAVVQGHQHAWFGLSGYFQHSAGKTLVLNPGPRGTVLSVDVATRTVVCA
jgi:Icc-related predicted phosphoesterase